MRLPWLEVCQEPQSPKSKVGGCWWFLTRYLTWYVIFTFVPNFNSSMIRSVSHPRSPYLEEVDGSLPGTWRIGSSLTSYIIMVCNSLLLCPISALAWLSVCQEPPIFEVYLEDVDDSWPGFWRMGSSLISWIIMICDPLLVCQILTLAQGTVMSVLLSFGLFFRVSPITINPTISAKSTWIFMKL